jgi:hypothetical protein
MGQLYGVLGQPCRSQSSNRQAARIDLSSDHAELREPLKGVLGNFQSARAPEQKLARKRSSKTDRRPPRGRVEVCFEHPYRRAVELNRLGRRGDRRGRYEPGSADGQRRTTPTGLLEDSPVRMTVSYVGGVGVCRMAQGSEGKKRASVAAWCRQRKPRRLQTPPTTPLPGKHPCSLALQCRNAR